MNAAVWDAEVTRGLRCTLFAQHLGMDTARLDGAALRLFQDIAAAIASKWKGARPTGKAWLSPCRRKPTPENRV